MQVSELPVDHERLRRSRRLTRRQGQRASARDGDAARSLDDPGECEQAPAELLHELGVERLLVELRMRVRRSRPRPLSATRRQRWMRHLGILLDGRLTGPARYL